MVVRFWSICFLSSFHQGKHVRTSAHMFLSKFAPVERPVSQCRYGSTNTDLTNATAPAPPRQQAPASAATASGRSLAARSSASAHGINGKQHEQVLHFFSKPIDPVRMGLLPAMLPPQSLFMCYTEPVPPLMLPSSLTATP
ncbi:hypothetical protein GUJ93_ZPchr0007g3398 [Zizania palustris]|uniref:Uncharacterized protein n=1 Tax=Zizania palustris TaxID=103762 RepID=A0A8J5VZ27_ZIZPA|nr:hypothetical protein GUJ93_ZPchr0007g3398 [Zizania palustris]